MDKKKHAYLIMAHDNFPLLLELIRLLDHERHDIYLHIDKKVPEADFARLQAECGRQKRERRLRSPLYFTERIAVHWGGYSQIACEMLLLKTAVKKGGYAYYHLLSGSDLPIKTPEQILAFFDELENDLQGSRQTDAHGTAAGATARESRLPEFLAMDGQKVPANVRERVSLYHIFRESSHPLAEPLDALFTRVQRLFKVDRLRGSALVLQKGANWFSITEDFARYAVNREAWIKKTFSRSVCADELFLQTLAASSAFMDRLYDPFGGRDSLANLRYVDWERGRNNNPYVFQKEDKEMLLALPHLFARKFTENIL